MSSDQFPFPVAISRLSKGETSREPQNVRAINWLLDQAGGPVVVVTPRRQFDGDSLKRLLTQPGVLHLTWRGFATGSLDGRRVAYAWPDRKHLHDLWGVEADALAVIEWNQEETAEWVGDANPVQLLQGRTVQATSAAQMIDTPVPLPNGVEDILEYVAGMAAGYSTGLKWNEEDKLKADMMNRPERWAPITVEQVRAKGSAARIGVRWSQAASAT